MADDSSDSGGTSFVKVILYILLAIVLLIILLFAIAFCYTYRKIKKIKRAVKDGTPDQRADAVMMLGKRITVPWVLPFFHGPLSIIVRFFIKQSFVQLEKQQQKQQRQGRKDSGASSLVDASQFDASQFDGDPEKQSRSYLNLLQNQPKRPYSAASSSTGGSGRWTPPSSKDSQLPLRQSPESAAQSLQNQHISTPARSQSQSRAGPLSGRERFESVYKSIPKPTPQQVYKGFQVGRELYKDYKGAKPSR